MTTKAKPARKARRIKLWVGRDRYGCLLSRCKPVPFKFTENTLCSQDEMGISSSLAKLLVGYDLDLMECVRVTLEVVR